ncbi:MAG: hypothetical protein ACI8ZM_005727 [Crocinitomix sp.]|jgi:uncharacterized protein (DUF427 family)
MKKAIWNGTVIAESDETINIEGNHYFPPSAINQDFFEANSTHTVCPWKGTASYFDIIVAGERNKDAAWFYPETSELAKNIKGYIAFWKGVKVE